MATLQTLDRGLAALEVISQRTAGISVAELADHLDVHRAICYRIVSTLEAHALVARTEDGRIRLGAGTAVLAARFEPQLLRATGPVLQRLAAQTGATTHVSMAQGTDCVVVRVAEPPTRPSGSATAWAAGTRSLAGRPGSPSWRPAPNAPGTTTGCAQPAGSGTP